MSIPVIRSEWSADLPAIAEVIGLACRERGAGTVFILGDSGYYGRFCFELASPHGFFYKGVVNLPQGLPIRFL